MLDALIPSLAGSLVTGLFHKHGQDDANRTNIMLTRETNKQNMDMFNRQFDYTKATQAEAWNREDNQLVRRVNDAEKAGLSPLAALGGSNQASIVSQPSAPRMEAPQVNSVMSGFNFDSMADAFIAGKRLEIDKQNADTQAKKVMNEKEIADQSLQQSATIEANKLETATNNLKMQLDQNRENLDKQLAQDMIKFNGTLALQTRAQNFEEKLQYQKYLIDDINSLVNEADKKTGGQSSAYKVYTEENSYRAAMNAWTARYNDFITTQLDKPTKSSYQTGAGANSGAGISEYGTGGFNYQAGEHRNTGGSLDYTERDRQKVIRWLNANPVPIYRPAKRW